MRSSVTLLKVVLSHSSTLRFYISAILGFGFSIAVILSTIGLMDGFEATLKSGLKSASGDLTIFNEDQLFSPDKVMPLKKTLYGIQVMAPTLQLQAMVASDEARGIIVRGVDSSFNQVSRLELSPRDGVVIGQELAQQLSLKIGDDINLMFPRGSESLRGMPDIFNFPIRGIVEHGIHEKDLRYVYMALEQLQRILDQKGLVNNVAVKLEEEIIKDGGLLELKIKEIEDVLTEDFSVRPYWSDFSNLIEAVEVEKISITIILQLIVVVSIFNILALLTFMGQRNAKEFFLFRAMGVNFKQMSLFWFLLLFVLWFASYVFGLIMTFFFDFLLQNLPWLQIPGEVYVLTRLQIILGAADYLLVALVSLFWISLVYLIGYWRLKRKPVLHGLREEFT